MRRDGKGQTHARRQYVSGPAPAEPADFGRVIVLLDAGLDRLPIAQPNVGTVTMQEPGGTATPSLESCTRRSRDTRISCSRRSGSLATMARLAASAAASDGGGAVENTKGRPRWTRYSIAHEEPATKAPPTPSAFPAG